MPCADHGASPRGFCHWPSASLHACRCCQCRCLLLPLHVLQRDKCLGLLVPLPLLPGVWVPGGTARPRCGCRGSQWHCIGAGCCMMAPSSTGIRGWGGQKLQKPSKRFSGRKNEAVVSPSGGSPGALRCLLLTTKHRLRPGPWCLAYICLGSHGVLHPGMGLSEGRGEGWPWGRGSERVIPRGEGQKPSALGEGVRRDHLQGERVIPSSQQHNVETSKPQGRKPPSLPSSPRPPVAPWLSPLCWQQALSPCPSLPGPLAVGHLPPEQQPHRLWGGVWEDVVHPVLLVPADPEYLSVAGGQWERAVGAGALPDTGLAGGLPLHPPWHWVHWQGERWGQPHWAQAGPGENKWVLEGSGRGCCYLGLWLFPWSSQPRCLCHPVKLQLKKAQPKN